MKSPNLQFGQVALAGIVGGIVGTMAMAASQQVMTALSPKNEPTRKLRLRRAGHGVNYFAQAEPRSHEQWHTTSEGIVRELFPDASQETRALIGSGMHYAFGAGAGTAYTLGQKQLPQKYASLLTAGRGSLYGALVWVIADELMMPMVTRWSPPPQKTPLRLHLYSLACHLAYGMTLDGVTRNLPAISAALRHLSGGNRGPQRMSNRTSREDATIGR
ncbi:MAG TPA: DUF1440 domain-containing protein [Tepidisphaeraceae bacterium]|jgi:hypothetical protein